MAGISAVSGGTGFIPTQSKKDVTSAASAAEQKVAAPVSEPPPGANAQVAGATASKAPNGAAALSNTLQSQYDASRVDTSAVDGRAAQTETGSADTAEAAVPNRPARLTRRPSAMTPASPPRRVPARLTKPKTRTKTARSPSRNARTTRKPTPISTSIPKPLPTQKSRSRSMPT